MRSAARKALAGLVFVGCLAPGLPAWAQEPPAVLEPCDTCVPGIRNFAKVSEALWRGDQPTAEGFKKLEAMGVKTIVNLRHDADDLPLLNGTGLKYLCIPSWAFHPKTQNIVRFLKVMEDPANWPVFVHCAQGRDRTGYNTAAYRIVVQGWTADRAIQEMRTFHFNEIWFMDPHFLRKLKPETIKERLQTEPLPEFQRPAP